MLHTDHTPPSLVREQIPGETFWAKTQRVLFAPTTPVMEDDRLPVSMLFAFLLLIFLFTLIMAVNPFAPVPRRIIIAFASAAALVGYTLRWSKNYRLSGLIAVLIVSLPPYANVLMGMDPNDAFKFLVIPLLTGGLWLSARGFGILFGVLIAAMMLVPLVTDSVGYHQLDQVVIFLSLVSFLIIASITFRSQARKRIERQNDELAKEISVRKKAEEGLRVHRERLEELVEERTSELRSQQQIIQGIMEHSPAVIYVKESDGTYRLVNPLFCEIFSLKPEQIVSKTDHDLFPKKMADQFRTNDLEVIESGEAVRSEEIAVHVDGTEHTYISLKFPLSDADGKTCLVCGISTDITDRKKDERALQKAMEELEELKNRLEAENIYLQEEIRVEHEFETIISKSSVQELVKQRIEQAAKTDATVLILGETGTGKELVAQAIHRLSPRSERPLVRVNCAALPENLIENELFGHEKGAFTDAKEVSIGRFELANDGTIFLDEIGDLPLHVQAKMLRVLQEGEIERLGSNQTVKVNTRIIAATNRNLVEDVSQKRFREDLYYRLNVFPIKCPPLRERKEDIPLLVQHFVEKHGNRFGKKVTRISHRVINDLMAYSWPGNVRELENLIERSLIISQGAELRLSDWAGGSQFSARASNGSDPQIDAMFLPRSLRSAVTDLKRMYILKVLGHAGDVQKKAAEILEIQPPYLSKLIRDLGIRPGNEHQNDSRLPSPSIRSSS